MWVGSSEGSARACTCVLAFRRVLSLFGPWPSTKTTSSPPGSTALCVLCVCLCTCGQHTDCLCCCLWGWGQGRGQRWGHVIVDDVTVSLRSAQNSSRCFCLADKAGSASHSMHWFLLLLLTPPPQLLPPREPPSLPLMFFQHSHSTESKMSLVIGVKRKKNSNDKHMKVKPIKKMFIYLVTLFMCEDVDRLFWFRRKRRSTCCRWIT